MKPFHLVGRSASILSATVLLVSSVSAGTNDLFNVASTLKLKVNGQAVRYRNTELINVALGQATNATLPPDVALGLQCNCQTLQMDLVLWRPSTFETLLPLAGFGVAHVQASRKTAKVDCIEGAYDANNSIMVMGDRSRIVVRLATNGCAARTTMTLTGQFAVATLNGVVSLKLSKSKIQSYGPQLRPPESTGTNSLHIAVPCDGSGTNGTGAAATILSGYTLSQ